MTPQLWTRNLEWLEWRQMHPDLDDREAEYLYQMEQKMFQNYRDEIIRQAQIRQAKLSGDLMNLSADISTVLTQGGRVPFRYSADYDGLVGSGVTYSGVFLGSGTHSFIVGDIFKVFIAPPLNINYNGLWKVTSAHDITKGNYILAYSTFQSNISLYNKIADLDGVPI